MIVPWVFHRAITLPIFCFCSKQLLSAMLPTSGTSMSLLITEIFGMKDFEDVRGLCNLSILWGEKRHRMGGTVSNHCIWSFIVQQLKTFLPFPCPQPLCSCPDTSFCCQLSFAKMFIMPFCKLDPWITFQKKEVLGGIISWDHLADPAVSLLSGGCISTAKGVTNQALQRNGWGGGGGDRQHCHPKEHPQSYKGRPAGLHSHTLSGVMAKPLAVTGILL